MNYVMSDLHGQFGLYKEMLAKINFGRDDKLYILGDLCDRGPSSAELYLDVMSKSNIFCIKGNHELLAEKALPKMLASLGKENVYEALADDDVLIWFENGGDTTLESFLNVDMAQRVKIAGFIKGLPYYKHLKVNGREFVLAHAGLGNFEKTKPLDSYTPWELVWTRPNFHANLFQEENNILSSGIPQRCLLTEVQKYITVWAI